MNAIKQLMNPELIKAAASSTFGVLSLMCLLICVVALIFFRRSTLWVKFLVFLFMFVGVAGFAYSTIAQKKIVSQHYVRNESCPLSIESAEYNKSKNILVVKLIGDANEVDNCNKWELISTSNLCNDGRIEKTNDVYIYVKKHCTLAEGAKMNFSYKMKNGEQCDKAHEIKFN